MSLILSRVESLLRQCANAAQIHQLHGVILTTGLQTHHPILSPFIAQCAALGLDDHAYAATISAARSQPTASTHLYNFAMRSLCACPSSADKAILLYAHIHFADLRPDAFSFPFVLKAAASLRAVDTGRQIHGQAVRTGLDWNVHVATTLVQFYADCQVIESAARVFDEMPERNMVSWTALISGYVHVHKPAEAVAVFRRMLVEGVEVDEVVMLSVLSACADLGALELGEWIRSTYIDRLSRRTYSIDNALIDMYVKSGAIAKAMEVFDICKRRTVVTWTTMIAGLALHGLATEALDMFARMKLAGIRPNEVTFIAILSACSHAGLVQLGRQYFDEMSSVYNVKPRIDHYGCMVALLARAGRLCEAEDMVVKIMPFEPTAAIWGSLLNASRIHEDAELAARAALELQRLEPGNSGNYSLLSNTYSALGRWDEAGIVRKGLKEIGVRKMQGWSSIEVDKRFKVFGSGHGEGVNEEVFKIAEQINEESKLVEMAEKEQQLIAC